MDEQHARHAAGLGQAWNGNVITNNHHFDFLAKATGALCRQAEIKTVSGIVRDDEKAAGFSGDSQNRSQDGVKARRRKNLAADCGREHALADIACVRRFVT